jgi:cytochrome bd-type quinol oxidase subunit 2
MADIILESFTWVFGFLFLTAVQIYRCFVIWNREKRVLVLPMLLFLAGVASKCWAHYPIVYLEAILTYHSANTSNYSPIYRSNFTGCYSFRAKESS